MAASLQDLKDRAQELGVPGSLIRSNLHDRDALESIIASFEKGKAHVNDVIRKKGVKMPVVKAKAKAKAKAGRPSSRAPRKAAVATPVKRGRGRPKGSVNKKSTPVAAKKPAARKVTRRVSSNGDAGRNTLGKLNFKNRDGWNPREGSATDVIFRALVKTRGDRHAAYDLLKGKVSSIIPKKKRGGGVRDKAEQLEMLMYRVHRTLFDFAVQTGQHVKSENRVEYGTGGTGRNGSRSKPTARKAVSKAKAKPAARRGRPAKAKPVAAKRRGRPAKAKARR